MGLNLADWVPGARGSFCREFIRLRKKMTGSALKLPFSQNDDGLHINLPENKPSLTYALTLKIS